MKVTNALITLIVLSFTYPVYAQSLSCTEIFNTSNKKVSDFAKAISCIETSIDKAKTPFPVGSVLFSKLEPKVFEKHYGSKWVLADGSRISTKTKYYIITGEGNVPDLRGVFIRGLNLGRSDGKGDANNNRNAGDYQASSTKLPNNAFSISHSGTHAHGDPTWNGSSGPYELATTIRGPGGSDFGAQSAPSTQDGDHVHSFGGGDTESRPRNVALHPYIKVN